MDYSKAFVSDRTVCSWRLLKWASHNTTRFYFIRSTLTVEASSEQTKPSHIHSPSENKCTKAAYSIFFNIFGEYILMRALEDWSNDVSIGGDKLSNLCFADDSTFLAVDEAEMHVPQQNGTIEDLELKMKGPKSKIFERTAKL